MEYISQNIGANKVIISVASNEFEETQPYVEEDNLFGEIENIIDEFRDAKPTQRKQDTVTKGHIPPKTKHPTVVASRDNRPSSVTTKPQHVCRVEVELKGFDSLISCILEHIDQTFTLLSLESKKNHVDQFLKKMLSHIEISNVKHTGFNKNTIKGWIDAQDIELCNFMSVFTKKTIAIKDDTWHTFGALPECIVINCVNDVYSLVDTTTYDDLQKKIVIERIKRLEEDGTLQKLNSLLVKDLKNIAEELYIDTFKVEDGKKKSYLKPELKDLINRKIEEYKQ
jgi:hypothetical protein